MIHHAVRDSIAVLQLDRGPANALDLAEITILTRAVRAAAEGTRGVVITGRGRTFCAGLDLDELIEGGADTARAVVGGLDGLYRAVFDLSLPVVAAVNGHAVAGGCLLAAACDVVLMSSGRIGMPEISVGLPVPPAAHEIFRHRTGIHLGRLLYGGDLLTPAEARGVGLVDEVVDPDELLTRAHAVAGRLGGVHQRTFAVFKAQLHRTTDAAIVDAVSRDAGAVADLWSGADARSAVRSYKKQLEARRS